MLYKTIVYSFFGRCNCSMAFKLLRITNDSSSHQAYTFATQFNKELDKANYVVVLTGAGISAESGIPTFRGPGGFWRNFNAQVLANKKACLPLVKHSFVHLRGN